MSHGRFYRLSKYNLYLCIVQDFSYVCIIKPSSMAICTRVNTRCISESDIIVDL